MVPAFEPVPLLVTAPAKGACFVGEGPGRLVVHCRKSVPALVTVPPVMVVRPATEPPTFWSNRPPETSSVPPTDPVFVVVPAVFDRKLPVIVPVLPKVPLLSSEAMVPAFEPGAAVGHRAGQGADCVGEGSGISNVAIERAGVAECGAGIVGDDRGRCQGAGIGDLAASIVDQRRRVENAARRNVQPAKTALQQAPGDELVSVPATSSRPALTLI